MSQHHDVLIIGSGPAGVSAAFPLVAAGLDVMMADGGGKAARSPLEQDFLAARKTQPEQWKWMVGEDFYALHGASAASPKLRVPAYQGVFDGFKSANKLNPSPFITIGSLALGGLSNVWGCGVARWSALELASFPFPAAALEESYAAICKRIGVSGRAQDELADYFGVDEWAQPPLPADALHQHLLAQYTTHQNRLRIQGFRGGIPRLAALSQPHDGRLGCCLTSNCLWGCARRALYNAADELPALQRQANFTLRPGFIVQSIARQGEGWVAHGIERESGQPQRISAGVLILAAGTLATTRLVLAALNHVQPVRLLSCPTAAYLLWLPRFLGKAATASFGLGQLSYALEIEKPIHGFGSTFALAGLPVSEFLRHVPLSRRYALPLLKNLLSSCLVGNLFLPGHLTQASVTLDDNQRLHVKGEYAECVPELMNQAAGKLNKSFRKLGAVMLPGSFQRGAPGSDIHYTGTLPMHCNPQSTQTSHEAEVAGLPGVYVADGACLPYLSEKSHTLTIMANADRMARLLARKLRA